MHDNLFYLTRSRGLQCISHPPCMCPPPFTYQVISGYCTVPRAIQITSSTVSVQALYARIARYKIRDGRMQDVERNTNASNASNASISKSPPKLTAPQPSLVTRSRAHEHKRTKVYENALKWAVSPRGAIRRARTSLNGTTRRPQWRTTRSMPPISRPMPSISWTR